MMPFYTCFAFSDSLSAAQKANIAEEITRIHTKLTGAPRSFVRVLFHEMQSSDIFTGGKPLPCAMIRGVIRAGRSAEVKKQLLSELWTMLQDATGLEDDKLLVSIQDNPANNAMEAGEILPEPQHEAEWFAGLGRTDH
jgi:phenylpyruvate tautomerase PptA (4-oxalocrotonate tautomerase family)